VGRGERMPCAGMRGERVLAKRAAWVSAVHGVPGYDVCDAAVQQQLRHHLCGLHDELGRGRCLARARAARPHASAGGHSTRSRRRGRGPVLPDVKGRARGVHDVVVIEIGAYPKVGEDGWIHLLEPCEAWDVSVDKGPDLSDAFGEACWWGFLFGWDPYVWGIKLLESA
jgi:hypothetical protein